MSKIFILTYITDRGFEGGITEYHIVSSANKQTLTDLADKFIPLISKLFPKLTDKHIELQKKFNSTNMVWRDFLNSSEFSKFSTALHKEKNEIRTEFFGEFSKFTEELTEYETADAEFVITELSVI